MASLVNIWNAALSHLGQRANITDPDEASAAATHCRTFYPMALATTLERYTWSNATRREVLTPVENPVDHWMFAYAMPNECVKMRAVLMPGSTDDSDEQDFAVETNAVGALIIYTNVEDAVGKFTYLATDTVKFPPMLVTALSFDLAAFLVGPIVKEMRMKEAMTKQAAYYTSLAEAADANASHSTNYANFVPSHLRARN